MKFIFSFLFVQVALSYRLSSHRPSANVAIFSTVIDAPNPVISEKIVVQPPSALKALMPVLAASFCAAALMYPLDLVRALKMANAGSGLGTFQLLSNFKDVHGWAGFFTQGLAPELARSTWMRFVKFGLFPVVHLAITRGVPENKGSSFTKAVAGALTAVPEVWTIMPLEIAKIALQLDSKKVYANSMFKAMNAIYKTKGAIAFTVGYIGVQLRQSLWTAGYFASLPIFEKNVNTLFKKLGLDPTKGAKSTSQLISGFLAGVFGAALNTPCDTIRSVVQKRVLGDLVGANTFLTVGEEIVKSRGVGALYAGFGFKALHLGGGGALMAFLLPFFKKLFGL